MTAPQQPQQQLTPLLGWEIGILQANPTQNVLVFTLNTLVGPIKFFVGTEDADNFIKTITEANAKAKGPQLLTPVRTLMGPNGQPIFFNNPVPPPPVPGEPIGPPMEQINDEGEEPNHTSPDSQ